VNVYTVDAPERQRELIGWGIDAIFTNRPAQLRDLLERPRREQERDLEARR